MEFITAEYERYTQEEVETLLSETVQVLLHRENINKETKRRTKLGRSRKDGASKHWANFSNHNLVS